jgi:hypothetical protein
VVLFYILPEEREDREEMRKFYRSTQHKGHIEKVMVLAATARPRFDAEGHCVFDGKVGIWPFTGVRLAERNSVNRPAGTELLVNVNCTKETYKQKLLECVIPAIRKKFPVNNWDASRPIRIQQDNAMPHWLIKVYFTLPLCLTTPSSERALDPRPRPLRRRCWVAGIEIRKDLI